MACMRYLEPNVATEDISVAIPVLAPANSPVPRVMNVNDFYCLHGIPNEVILKETAESIDVELTGEMKSCIGCSIQNDSRNQ